MARRTAHGLWGLMFCRRDPGFWLGAACVLALLFLSSHSSALIDLTIFGPKRYDRLKGKPTVYTDTFEHCEPSYQALLKVTNGDSKKTRIKAARIYINGAKVAKESDFKQKISSFEKVISIQEHNELKIILKSGHGYLDKLSKYRAKKAELEQELARLAAFKDEISSVSSMVDIEKLLSRFKDISKSHRDREALLEELSRSLDDDFEDNSEPASDEEDEIDSGWVAKEREKLDKYREEIKEAVKETEKARDTLNKTPKNKRDKDYDKKDEALKELAKLLKDLDRAIEKALARLEEIEDKIEKIKKKGPSFLIIEIIGKGCDDTLPVISNSEPSDGSLLNTGTPRISAQYFDEAGGSGIDTKTAKMTVDGKDVTSNAAVSATGITYTPPSKLPEGLHTATVTVADRAKNSAALTWHFTTDTIAPVPKITTPQNGQYLKTSTIAVSGTLDDSTAIVTVNNQPAENTGSGFSLSNLLLTEGENTITVEAKDPAGNIGRDSITITLDTIAPAVNVITPQADDFVKTPQITVSGTVTELHPAGLWINNTPAQISGGSFSLSGVGLIEGPNTITVRATDLAANETTTTVPVTLDTVLPVVTITAPMSGLLTNNPQVTVTGSVNEPIISLTINDSPAPFTGQTFSIPYTLTEGPNTLTVTALDRATNPGGSSVNVALDTIAPDAPVISQPATPTHISTVSVSGVAEANSFVTLYKTAIGITTPEIAGTVSADNSGNFSFPSLVLSDGKWTFTATARDAAGNTGAVSASVEVHVDTRAPVIAPDVEPASGALLNTGAPRIAAAFSDEAGGSGIALPNVRMTVDGTDVTASAVVTPTGIAYTPASNLPEGSHSVTVGIADAAGNQAATTWQFTTDTVAPEVRITSHQSNQFVITSKITVTGTTSETVAAVTINGQPAQIDQTGAGYSLADFALAEGENTITVNATDPAGNSGTASITLTLDTVKPVIEVTTPIHNSYVNTPAITVTGTVTELNPDGFWINDNLVSLNQGSFSAADFGLTPGINVIRLRAKDRAGNESSASVFVTLDTTPPAVTITSPVNGSIRNNASVTISGTVNEPVLSVTINGQAAQVSGSSFTLAGFTLAEGENTLTAEAVDRAGNTGNANVQTILDTQTPAVTLTAPGQAAAGAQVSISTGATDNRGLTLIEVSANGTPIWSFTPNSELSTQNSFAYTISPDAASGSLITLETKAYDVAGNIGAATAQVQITQGPTGPGYIQGEVYDDTKGLRLEGATADFIATDGHGLTRIATQEDGGYFTEAAAGDYLVTLAKAGYTTVERTVTVKPEKNSVAVDARLTPISTTQNLIDANGGTATANLAANGHESTRIELAIPAGAINEQIDLRVTPVSNQGLMGMLPFGWSPIAAVDISVQPRIDANEREFGQVTTLKVPLSSGPTITASSSVTFVTYDRNSHQWIVREPGTVSNDAAFVTASISSTGQYAFVLSDSGSMPSSPPASPLTPNGSTTSTLNSSPTATGRVVPPAAPPSAGLKAVGEVVLTPSPLAGEGEGEGGLSSGLIVTARVTERFDLFSGEVVAPSEYVQDLVLYRYPCITSLAVNERELTQTNSQASSATSASSAVKTTFPVTPSREYTITELMLGKVGIEVNLREGEASTGIMVGAEGARLLDSDGNVLVIPQNGLTRTVPVETKTVSPSTLTGIVGNDFTLLRAVDVALSNQTLAGSAELSIPAPSGLNSSLPIIVAKLIDVKGTSKLKLVALGRLSGSLITTRLNSLNGLNGISTSGTYLFLQAKSPLGFITGTVKDGSGNPYPSALTTSSTCSLVDLTGPDGKYLIAGTIAAFTAAATDIYKNDAGTATGMITSANQVVTTNLTIQVTPPRIVSITPADNATGVEPNASVVITFSEAVDKTTITSANIVLKDASNNALPGVFSVNPEGTVVTLYPSALLASETRHTLTISRSIRDLQGYLMGQDVETRFTVKDTTPPSMPPAGSITASFPDADGYVTVTATQGSAEAAGAVLIINDTSGEILTVSPATNGSFIGRIMAQLGDEIKIVSMDSSGNQTLITYITFKSDDGKYLVTAKGGTVEGEGGLRLDIPEGALLGPTVVKITPVLEENLPHQLPQGGHFLAAVSVDTGGVGFNKEVKLSVPAPANIPADAEPFVARPSEYVNAEGATEKVYEIVDSAIIASGRLSSACEPFPGLLAGLIYAFAYPDVHPVILHGYLYRDKNQNGLYDADTDIPISGAVVRSPDALYYYIARTDSTGHYATYSWAISNIGTCRNYRLIATDPYTQATQNFSSTLCEPPYTARKDFGFSFFVPPSADHEAPRIEVNVTSDKGFISGTTSLGANLTISAKVMDNGGLQQGGASIQVTPPSGAYQPSPALNCQNQPPATINSVTYTVQSCQAQYQPTAAGPYTITVTAMDTADPANTGTRTITLSVVNQTDIPSGIPGPPRVLDGGVFPAPGSQNITAATRVVVYFTEPVNNVDTTTFTLHAVSSLTDDPGFAPGQVTGSVVTSIEAGRMKAEFSPAGNLTYSTRYEIRLSNTITDVDEGNALEGNDPSGYKSAFDTKIPDVYSLEEQFDGHDIAILGDYAYIAGGEAGWQVVNVTDPAHPAIAYTETHTSSVRRWEYRGVAAQENTSVTVNGFPAYRPVVALTENITYPYDAQMQFGMFRIYDVTNPAAPNQIGYERLAMNFSGIPGRLALSGKYAYVCNAAVGLQVVDMEKATAAHEDGAAIVGYYDSWTAGYRSPADLAVLKGKLYAATTSGHFLVLDIGMPEFPNKINSLDPTSDFYAYRVAVAGDYAYVDGAGNPRTADIALVSSRLGNLYVIDITDPYNLQIIGVLQGVGATDISISPTAGMAFVSTRNGVLAIDIKNPTQPKVIATVSDLGPNSAIAEKGGWVYTANANTGMKVVNLDPVYLEHYRDDEAFPDSYYPALGAKTITLLGRDYTYITPLKPPARVKFNRVVPSIPMAEAPAGVTVAAVVQTPCPGTTAPCATVDTSGLARFTVRTSPTFTASEINLEFEIDQTSISGIMNMFPDTTNPQSYMANVKLRVKNNANVTLDEVLKGEAVFVYDTDDKHKGEYDSSITDDSQKKFYFVQELLNQVVSRKRTLTNPFDTGYTYALIDENGQYDFDTYNALVVFKDNFKLNVNDKVGPYPYSPDGAVDNTSATFRKLMKDYGKRQTGGMWLVGGTGTTSSDSWLYKVIDRETLVGNVQRIPGPTEAVNTDNADVLLNSDANNIRKDSGLYELYENAVERFVNAMINEGDRYANHTVNYRARANASAGAITQLQDNTPADNPDGQIDQNIDDVAVAVGESYSYGDIDTPEQFDAIVNQANITNWRDYINGHKPGKHEYEHAYWSQGQRNPANFNTSNWPWTTQWPPTVTQPITIAYDFNLLSPDMWGGIDCNGFVQRVINTADNSSQAASLGLDPKVHQLNAIGDKKPRFYFTEVDRAFAFDRNQVKLIHQGDIVQYSEHISLVHSDGATACTTNQNGQTTCTYEIIHASGSDEICYQPAGSTQTNCDFNRKAVRNLINTELQNSTLRNPTGFGRIKLWD